MSWVNRILFGLNLLLFAALFAFFQLQGSGTIVPGSWEYKDLVSVLLTTVTVVLAFIGFIVAGAAVWGYQSIRSLAEEKAEATSKAACDDYLKSPAFTEQVDQAIKNRLAAEAKDAVQNALAPATLRAEDAPEFQEPVTTDATLPKDEKGDKAWQD